MQAPLAHTGSALAATTTAPPQAEAAVAPAPNPPHTSTESTLAPTSEFVRYFLLALPARYIFRGVFAGVFHDKLDKIFPGIVPFRDRVVEKAVAHKWADADDPRAQLAGRGQNITFGLGSAALTLNYSHMVYRDMFNLFSEAVAFESGKDASKVTFRDLRHSDNRIVSKTVDNFYVKTGSRAAIDMLFFFPKLVKWPFWGDALLGAKGLQLFAETWKREPTLFEHVAALVNSKVNPKNGLGQPLSTGEVFDLYQHYQFQFNEKKAFTNVLDDNPAEARIWAEGKPVFDRITELFNLTYSYKHATEIDNATGQPIRSADFGLPKFLYLLGHDMIDPARPVQTMMYIELANAHGMEAVKEARTLLASGKTIDDVIAKYPVTIDVNRTPPKALAPFSTKIGTKPTADLVIPESTVHPVGRTHEGQLHASPALASIL